MGVLGVALTRVAVLEVKRGIDLIANYFGKCSNIDVVGRAYIENLDVGAVVRK